MIVRGGLPSQDFFCIQYIVFALAKTTIYCIYFRMKSTFQPNYKNVIDKIHGFKIP